MKVKKIMLNKNKFRFIVIEDNGTPIFSINKYLKYIDNLGRSVRTQKAYSYCLKLYFEYLNDININYKDVNVEILSNFVGWLKNPYRCNKVKSLKKTKSKISNNSINLIITAVTNFYEYLYRTEQIENNTVEKLMKQLFIRENSKYKSFLHHANKKGSTPKNILKQKIPKPNIETLTREEVQEIYNAATNVRDKFLIQLLYETGFRIGEALSLNIEDLVFDLENGHKLKLVDRGDLPNGVGLKSGGRVIDISQDLMDAFDDYAYEILDELEIDSNFLFVKIKGENKGKPLEYTDINDIFKRIRKKTGIDFHPHMFRHTHATMYYDATKDIKQVQERLGHAQVQTTMNLYIHNSNKEKRESWEKAEHLFKLSK